MRRVPHWQVRCRPWLAGLASATLVAGLLAGGPPAAADPPGEPAAAVEPRLLTQLAAGGTGDFWVYLREQPRLAGAAGLSDRRAQGRLVHRELVSTARGSQAGLLAMLDAEGVDYTPYWITNTVRVSGDAGLLERIVARPEVAQVTADRVYELPEPLPAGDQPRVAGIEWNVDRIGAPQVWDEFATTGEGILVGTIDSGVQYDHPALVGQYRGNLGGGEFDHNYHWHDPSSVCGSPSLVPCDNNGHGTHVTGTVVGDDGGDNRIGVAPGAQWIAAKGCETNQCSQAALLSSGQFMLAPTDLSGANPDPDRRPHIVNNSWGGGATDDPWYRPTVQAWVAAGIFPQFSAGNTSGGLAACGSASNPGNLPESYAAGAFDIDGEIAGFSNRGPSPFGDDLIKPDISAPGVAVRSALPGDNYGTGSGTSMASPHVAGVVALIWSAAPAIERDLDATRELLDFTAIDTEDLTCGGEPGNNNVWGQGKLDAFAAVAQAPRGATGQLTGTITDAATGDPLPGATVTVTGEVDRQRTIGPDGGYSFTLPAGEYQVTASAFGYEPQTVPAGVTDGGTTVRDFPLAAPVGAHLHLAPQPLEFGEVPVGSRGGPAALHLTSTGTEPVTVSGLTEPGGGFNATGGSCGAAPFTLSRLESCTLEYEFTPVIEGAAEATVLVTSDAAGSPQPITLRGTGGAVAGAELWVARYNGPGVDSDVAHALELSPDGTVAYVTGRSGGDGTLADYLTAAYDTATGEELWVARFDGAASNTDEGRALAVSPDGSRVYVTGWSQSGSFGSDADYATVAYDAGTGEQLWVAIYEGPGNHTDRAHAVGVSEDGATVFVTGESRSASTISSTDYATVAYEAATGQERWVARYTGPGDNQDGATALLVSGDTVFVTGASRTGGFGTDDYATVAYDVATGQERWVARYDGPAGGIDRAADLAISPDGGRLYVTGTSAGDGTGNDYATVAYDPASGEQLWVARYDGPDSGQDAAAAVAPSPDGGAVFVTGGSGGEYATVAYDPASGEQRWVARYDGPVSGPDDAAAITVSPDSAEVYVTGTSRGIDWDYATVAYQAASGEELWVARYNGPGNDGDGATAIAVTPDGARVLVTGQSVGIGTGADYATVAYGAAPPEITLAAQGRRVQGTHVVDLSWHGAISAEIDIYRDGELIATVPNDGAYTDEIGARGPGSYTYRVCAAGSGHCSNERTVRFGGPPAQPE